VELANFDLVIHRRVRQRAGEKFVRHKYFAIRPDRYAGARNRILNRGLGRWESIPDQLQRARSIFFHHPMS